MSRVRVCVCVCVCVEGLQRRARTAASPCPLRFLLPPLCKRSSRRQPRRGKGRETLTTLPSSASISPHLPHHHLALNDTPYCISCSVPIPPAHLGHLKQPRKGPAAMMPSVRTSTIALLGLGWVGVTSALSNGTFTWPASTQQCGVSSSLNQAVRLDRDGRPRTVHWLTKQTYNVTIYDGSPPWTLVLA